MGSDRRPAGVNVEAIRRPYSAPPTQGYGTPGSPRERIPVRFAGPHTRRDSVSGVTVRDNFTLP